MTAKIPCVELFTGQKMPIIGLGTFQAKDDDIRVALNTALECGYRHIDTAFEYANEEVIGEVLSEWFESGRLKREDLFITTKLPFISNREEDVSRILQKSLDWLRISYVDLYLIHFPCGVKVKNELDMSSSIERGEWSFDPTDLEALWRGMEAQVDSGKAKSIGISNFNSKQIERIMKASRIKPANLQVEINGYHIQKELRNLCEQNNIAVCGYAPLGAPYQENVEGPILLENPVVLKIAAQHKKTSAQVLLRYMIQLNIIVIPKSSKAERIKENFEVFNFELTAEEMAELNNLDRGKKGKLFTFTFLKGFTLAVLMDTEYSGFVSSYLMSQNIEVSLRLQQIRGEMESATSATSAGMTAKIPCVEFFNGQKMPIIGLGTFQAKDDDLRVALNAALECGYRHIDAAFEYVNEEGIGEVLSEWFKSGRLKREDLFITTKLPFISNREEDVSRILQKSLDWLRVSYVDLYLIHFPCGIKVKNELDMYSSLKRGEWSYDPTDIEALWRGMEAQVDSGKAKAIGLSSFNSKQIERIMKASRIKPANLQVEIHGYHIQKELCNFCEQNNITVCGFSPLGAPYLEIAEGPILLENPVVLKIAAQHKKTSAQVLLRHLIQRNVIVIPKSSNPERIKENFEVFNFELTAEEMAELNNLDRGKKGKTFTFAEMEGMENQPEYPFHLPY
ncbi:uncharacterized protein LOC143018667 [Oratosquilla oratoria]|uniref:uncharacterized protein LOC143018667 n=1 Tax=Oratosquilla oratoria TaxID=337810 RepID=UPI003F758698